jgi:hypothetical protein
MGFNSRILPPAGCFWSGFGEILTVVQIDLPAELVEREMLRSASKTAPFSMTL